MHRPEFNPWGMIPNEHLLESPDQSSKVMNGSPSKASKTEPVVFQSRLGSGVFGEVWKAEYHGRPVAAKVTSCPSGFREEELGLLKKNQGEHVVELLGVERTSKGITILMELCEGSLQDHLSEGFCHGEENFLVTCIGILEGLTAIHSTGTIFGDLKPDNILVQGDRLLFADFGDARDARTDYSRRPVQELGWGSPMYHSRPDVMKKKMSQSSDIWMFAQTAIHLWTKEVATSNPSPIPRDIPLLELIQHCLATNPEERPDVDVCLREAKYQLARSRRPESSPRERVSPRGRRSSLPTPLPSQHGSTSPSKAESDMSIMRRRLSVDAAEYYTDAVNQEFEQRMNNAPSSAIDADGPRGAQWMQWQSPWMMTGGPPPQLWFP